MESRRFTLTTTDSHGRPQKGEVLLAPCWEPDLAATAPAADAGFLIVLLEEPAPASARVSSPRVAVCSPGRRLDRPFAVREPPPTYEVDRHGGTRRQIPFPSLSASDIASYAAGGILSQSPLPVSAKRVFPARGGLPRLETLARALIERASGDSPPPDAPDPFLAALASAMAAPAPAGVEAVQPAVALDKLRKLLRQAERRLPDAAPTDSAASRIIARLRSLAAVDDAATTPSRARTLYSEPLALADDVFFCRSLARYPEPALELAAMRAYLESTVVPDSAAELALDRRVTLEQLPSAALFMEPHRLDGIRATFQYFRKRFEAAYQEHHRRYREACTRLALDLEETTTTARALGRLNGLNALGKPVGIGALAQYDDLRRALESCSLQEALAEALSRAPACPMCGVTLADEPPAERARDVSRRLQHALRQQQNRLSGAAIRQILSQRKEEKVEQFLRVIQASDLRGLAELLDDDLVAFLREMLAAPGEPEAPLLDRLRRAYPEVREESLEAAVGEFRRLLNQALAAERSAHPGRPPRVALEGGAARVPGQTESLP